MSTIANIYARQILDSRGNPTVEVDVITTAGALLFYWRHRTIGTIVSNSSKNC